MCCVSCSVCLHIAYCRGLSSQRHSSCFHCSSLLSRNQQHVVVVLSVFGEVVGIFVCPYVLLKCYSHFQVMMSFIVVPMSAIMPKYTESTDCFHTFPCKYLHFCFGNVDPKPIVTVGFIDSVCKSLNVLKSFCNQDNIVCKSYVVILAPI